MISPTPAPHPGPAAVPVVLVFEGRTPSKKNRYRIGVGRLFKDGKTVAWEKHAAIALIAQSAAWVGRGAPFRTSRVAMRFTYGDKIRRDTINAAETVLDLLVKSGILEDDNWKVMPSLELTGAYEKGVDRCVVEIWPA